MAACIRCGAPGKTIEVMQGEDCVVQGILCDMCHTQARRRFERLRRIFNILIDRGMDRRMANRYVSNRWLKKAQPSAG